MKATSAPSRGEGRTRVGEGREVGILSVSMDLGAGRRGVDMGPSALRIAGVAQAIERLGYGVREIGTVHAPGQEEVEEGEAVARYLAHITEVCRQSHSLLRGALADGVFPLVLGGDHSLTMGTGAAVADHYRDRDQPIGLLWVDAHTDMNEPGISPSGNVHGMSLSVLTGRGLPSIAALASARPAIDPRHVAVLGARQIDPREREAVREAGIRVFTMSEVDERGLTSCVDEAIRRISDGTAGFHVSFDLDALDPMEAPGVGTPVPGGFTYREAHLICEKVASSGGLLGFELVELNPVLDAGNVTAQVGLRLIESALGKTIL
ncbi:MAG: arginase [Gemmatimonadales bacterium]|nr:MAG: arginase [Gemmatimonadales bacterium]